MGRIFVDEGWRQRENMHNNNGFAAIAAEKDAWYQKPGYV
jgi:hypothetical protein